MNRILRSIGAVLAAFASVIGLSLGTDQVLHALHVYPPWDQPMFDNGLNALALSYRLVFGVLGGWITARLAPFAPVGHALVVGAVGTLISAAGAVLAIQNHAGPAWYPIALVATALPTTWLGASIATRTNRSA